MRGGFSDCQSVTKYMLSRTRYALRRPPVGNDGGDHLPRRFPPPFQPEAPRAGGAQSRKGRTGPGPEENWQVNTDTRLGGDRPVKGMTAGAHRRRRPAPRSGRGVVWTGLFLLLALVATVASRDLWPELIEDLLGAARRSTPPGLILWRTHCPAGTVAAVDGSGSVLVIPAAGDGPALLLSAESRDEVPLPADGTPLAVAVRESQAAVPSSEPGAPPSVWRVVVAAAAPGERDGTGSGQDAASTEGTSAGAGREGGGTFLWERISWHDMVIDPAAPAVGGGALDTCGETATSASASVDGAEIAVGLYVPDATDEPRGVVVAVGPAGQRLWSRTVGDRPVHRVAGRPRTGFIAAAACDRVTFLDTRGNVLWSTSFRGGVTDLALQGHGGPAVLTGDRLVVLDRRGNLLWRKKFETPVRALACAGERIAVAWGHEVLVFDEEGMERWSISADASVLRVVLGPAGEVAAVFLESGDLMVVCAPGTSATHGEIVSGTRQAGGGMPTPGPEGCSGFPRPGREEGAGGWR